MDWGSSPGVEVHDGWSSVSPTALYGDSVSSVWPGVKQQRSETLCSWSLLLFGPRFLSPFSTPSLPTFQPQDTDNNNNKKDREERKGDPWVQSGLEKGSIASYSLLFRGIEFLEASLIFVIRVSNFFLLLPNNPKQQPTNQYPSTPLRDLAFVYPLKNVPVTQL